MRPTRVAGLIAPTADQLDDAAATVIATHRDHPGSSVADDLAGLFSAARSFRVPSQDPELGRTPTLHALRTAKGQIVAALMDALDGVEAIGLQARQVALPMDTPVEVARAGNEQLLRGIAKRLDAVAERLAALDEAKTIPTDFPQQTSLLDFYIGAMRVELDLAKLHLTMGEKTIDFGALARAVEVMSELTSDFVVTVRAWAGRVLKTVANVAEEVHSRVRRLAKGVRAAITGSLLKSGVGAYDEGVGGTCR